MDQIHCSGCIVALLCATKIDGRVAIEGKTLHETARDTPHRSSRFRTLRGRCIRDNGQGGAGTILPST